MDFLIQLVTDFASEWGQFTFGLVFSIAIAWWFASKASKELTKETARLRRLNEILITGTERAGWIKVNRDAAGNTIGIVFNLEAEPGLYRSTMGEAQMKVGLNAKLGIRGDTQYVTPDSKPTSSGESPK